MVGIQYNEGEKVSHGGGVSREAVRALGEDGAEVAPLLGRRSKARAAASLESNGQHCRLGDGCPAGAACVTHAQNSPALGRAAGPEKKT